MRRQGSMGKDRGKTGWVDLTLEYANIWSLGSLSRGTQSALSCNSLSPGKSLFLGKTGSGPGDGATVLAPKKLQSPFHLG